MTEPADRTPPAPGPAPGPAAACPICGKPAAPKFHPFCSTRCADRDLHRWLGGVYRIESDEPAEPPARDED